MAHCRASVVVCAWAVLRWTPAAGEAQQASGDIHADIDDECLGDASGGVCAWSALQLRARRRASSGAEAGAGESGKAEVDTDCHDIQEGEVGACMNSITWAKSIGYPQHPDWYPDLDAEAATLADWQFYGWNTTHPTCPRPCTAKWDATWCDAVDAPELWAPAAVSEPVEISVLSYNLFWWNLYKIHGGLSADNLIKKTKAPDAYDVIGLQECEDPDKVFVPVGLQDIYGAFLSSKNTCVAYRKDVWELLDSGEDEVAMDMRTEFYGNRVAQWLRLKHKANGMTMLFVNHHGPLSVNSGGACGGKSTAHNLLKVMAKRGQEGDLLVLVGDFNANAASQTIQALWPHLHHVYNSKSFGGVDNIFANVPKQAVSDTKDLGSGGSDHHAISAVIALPESSTARTTVVSKEPGYSVRALEEAKGADGCLLEPKQLYVYSEGSWAMHKHNIVDPRVCCTACQGTRGCTAWVWQEWDVAVKGPLCTLRNGQPLSVTSRASTVSGLPQAAAVHSAHKMSSSA